MNYCYIEITLIYPFYFDKKNFFVILPRRNLNYHYHTMFRRFEMTLVAITESSIPLLLMSFCSPQEDGLGLIQKKTIFN